MAGKLEKLESLRGFAAIYVLFTHLQDVGYLKLGKYSFVLKFGQEAVMLFFILSGFVIHYSFQRTNDHRFITYLKKRFLRIYIPLLIVFTVNYVLYSIFSKPFEKNIFPELIGNLFMLQDLAESKPNVICNPFLMNGPIWSLSYEWWFYMIYFFLNKYFKSKMFGVVSILALTAGFTYIFYPNFFNRIFMYLIIWWAGVELAELYIRKKIINFYNIRKTMIVMFVCMSLMAINWYVHFTPGFKSTSYPFIEFRHLCFAIIAIFIALGWKKLNWIMFRQTIGLFTIFAPISYSIYISHYFLVIYPDYLKFINSDFFSPILGFCICICFSYLIENVAYPKAVSLLLRKKIDKGNAYEKSL